MSGTSVRSAAADRPSVKELARLGAVVEATPDVVATADREGRLLYLNRAGRRLLGVDDKSALKQSLDELAANPRAAQVLNEALAETFRTGSWHGEATLRRREPPQEVPVSIAFFAHQDEDGAVASASAVCRDISERKRLETALRSGQERMRAIVESAPDALVTMNVAGEIVDWNPEAEQLFGWSAAEVLGKPLDQIVIPESRRAEHRNGLERFLATGHGPLLGQTVEVSALQRNGEEFPAEICVTPIEVGGTIHFSAFVRDIRERKKFIADLQESEARLRESERRFRQLAESVKEVFWICSVDGREIFYVSPAFEEIWQRPVEALYRRPLEWLTFVHPADRDQMEAALRNRNAEAEFDQTYRIMRPDGSVRWVRDRGFPVRDEQGRTFRFAGISEDITERRLVEEALENSEALYHSLVDHLPVNISRKDLQGRITFANRRVCETLGMPLEKLVGLTDFDLFPPDLAQKYQADDQRVIETGQTFECVEEHADPGQGRIYVQVLKAPVYDSQERIIGIQVIWWDVTDKKRAEDELRRTAEELARSNRELEQFAYVASHDLQEPLRMVASYVQLLERRYKGKLDADADDFIRFSVDGALRMQRLISDLLAYARVGSRGKPFQPVKLESVYAEATANLQAAIRAEKAKVTRDPLPTIPGDAGQLVQLLQNLIANGIKFHGAEPAQVHVSASHEGDHWRFTVRDNGIGIDPQYRDKIFGIFQRLHGKGEYAGTGIGLAICKKIVERHNGQIWVDSELGKGCAFCFTLPDAAE